MTYNEALVRNALINELGAVTNLKPKAMTEKILLGIHYRKAADEWLKAREAISKEENATDEVKNEAIQTKATEDCGLADKRMSREAFEQVVEAVLSLGPLASMRSFLAMQNATEDEAPKIPVAMWLQAFAEALVAE